MNQLDEYNWAPLHRAILNDDLPEVIRLITQGADVNLAGKYDKTPLHVAVGTNRISIVKFLIDNKVSKADTLKQDRFGYTPLESALISQCVESIEILLSNLEVITQDLIPNYERYVNVVKTFNSDKFKDLEILTKLSKVFAEHEDDSSTLLIFKDSSDNEECPSLNAEPNEFNQVEVMPANTERNTEFWGELSPEFVNVH